MTVIKARETEYAGCRFRSRLEARWAVFMDTAGLGWDYEPEGLVIRSRNRVLRWLPDFWLHCGQWGEVKGALDGSEFLRLIALAKGVSDCGKGNDVVVLGHIPGWSDVRWPIQLHQHGGSLWAVPWNPEVACPVPCPAIPEARLTAELLLAGYPRVMPEWAEEPMDRARKARFEWGESG
jgi:hypothetical protein